MDGIKHGTAIGITGRINGPVQGWVTVAGSKNGTAIEYYEDGSKESKLWTASHGTVIEYRERVKYSETIYVNGKQINEMLGLKGELTMIRHWHRDGIRRRIKKKPLRERQIS